MALLNKIEYVVKWVDINNKKITVDFTIKHKYTSFQIGSTCDLNLEDEIFDFCFSISNSVSFLTPHIVEVMDNHGLNDHIEKLISLNKENGNKHHYEYTKDLQERDEELYFISAYDILEELVTQEEPEIDKASKLISSYFNIFNTNEITKNNWTRFVIMFDLNKQSQFSENYLRDEQDNPYLNNGLEKYNKYIEGKDINIYNIKKNNNVFTINNYLCENSKEIISVIINNIFASKPNSVIKKCELCEKLFLPKKSDTKYCNRKNDQYNKKTCKEVSEAINKKKYNEKDPLLYLRRKVYNKLKQSNIQSPSEKNQKEIDRFWAEDKGITRKYKLNLITSIEYEKWLLSFYKKNPPKSGDSN